jgi:hypothetical protein
MRSGVYFADLEKTVQSSTARFFTTEAVSQIPDIMQRAKREFENMAISAQVHNTHTQTGGTLKPCPQMCSTRGILLLFMI